MKKRGEASKGLRHPPPPPPSRPWSRSLHLGKNGRGQVGKQTMNFRAKISSGPALGASPSGSGCKVIDGETLPRPLGQMPRVGRQTGAFFFAADSQKPAACRPASSKCRLGRLCQGSAGPTWSCRWCPEVSKEGAAAFGRRERAG